MLLIKYYSGVTALILEFESQRLEIVEKKIKNPPTAVTLLKMRGINSAEETDASTTAVVPHVAHQFPPFLYFYP